MVRRLRKGCETFVQTIRSLSLGFWRYIILIHAQLSVVPAIKWLRVDWLVAYVSYNESGQDRHFTSYLCSISRESSPVPHILPFLLQILFHCWTQFTIYIFFIFEVFIFNEAFASISFFFSFPLIPILFSIHHIQTLKEDLSCL